MVTAVTTPVAGSIVAVAEVYVPLLPTRVTVGAVV
jgi:hypothetical protein